MAQLIIVEGPNRGKTFDLGKKDTLGRAEACSIFLNDRRVSDEHAEIRLRKNGYEIVNLDNTKSLLVNGEVFKQTRLQHGDWITIADTTLVFSEDSEPRDKKPLDVQAIDTDDLGRSQIQARLKSFEDADSVIESLERGSQVADTRLKTLYSLAHKLSTAMELRKLVERLAEETLELFKADRSTVMLTVDEDGRKVRPVVTRYKDGEREGEDTQISRTIVKEVFSCKDAILCTDALDDARFLSGKSIVDQNVRSFICAPLVHQGKMTGILQIDSTREQTFSQEDLELATAVAQFASVLIENSKAYRKRQEYNQTLFHLSKATKRISSFLDRDRILKEVVKLACMILSCTKSSVVLKNPETGRLRLESVQGMTKDVWAKIRGTEIGERFVKKVVEEGMPLLIPDVRELGIEPNPRYQTQSCLIVPIIQGEGQESAEVVGAICVADKSMQNSGGAFSGTDQKVLDILASHTAIALNNAELYERATVDVLTRVFVRRYFFQKLEDERRSAEKRHSPLSLLMLDLDNFGQVNKSYGIQAGDQVLRTVGATMKKCVRPEDTVARYGGEEFAVILPGADQERAHMIAERIRAAIEAEPIPISAEGEELHEIKKTTSIGAVTFQPGDSRDLLIKKADAAVRWAKAQGKNRVEVWNESIAKKLRRTSPGGRSPEDAPPAALGPESDVAAVAEPDGG
ncbi:diguanylate cyclase [bacterium]|nr:diguanylate cyclase [bacterium]